MSTVHAVLSLSSFLQTLPRWESTQSLSNKASVHRFLTIFVTLVKPNSVG
uniref:Uncharacterized protein n=1 Tax=Anguilla anguilla TaxID=7936 RepID=A0A0E9TTM9_ANGAN